MDNYHLFIGPMAYVDPAFYYGLHYAFWKMAEYLALFGAMAMFVPMVGRRYTTTTEKEGELI